MDHANSTANDPAQTSALPRLRAYATRMARSDILLRHRSYVNSVASFQLLTDDLEAVFAASQLREPQNARPWAPLFSAMFDVEHVRDKFTNALVRAQVAANLRSSDDFDYHREHWLFQGAAFIDRVRNAVLKAIRLLLRSRSERARLERDFKIRITSTVGATWSSVRDPLAHELGGGVDALTPYWLPLLSMDARVVDIEAVMAEIASSANAAKSSRNLPILVEHMARSTTVVIAATERIIGELTDTLEAQHP